MRGGDWFITFKSFNPPAMARNWANGYALKQRPGKVIHHSTYKTTPAEWLGERFLADAEYLERTNETAYRHEYLGEVVGSGTAVFENLKIQPITDEQLKTSDRTSAALTGAGIQIRGHTMRCTMMQRGARYTSLTS